MTHTDPHQTGVMNFATMTPLQIAEHIVALSTAFNPSSQPTPRSPWGAAVALGALPMARALIVALARVDELEGMGDKVAGSLKAELRVSSGLRQVISERESTIDVHYKSSSYYYAELVGIAQALGREHDGNEIAVGGMTQSVEVLITRVTELEKVLRHPKDPT